MHSFVISYYYYHKFCSASRFKRCICMLIYYLAIVSIDALPLDTSNKDICLLLEEFVVVTQLLNFPF